MCRKCDNDARVGGDPDDPIVVRQWLDQQDAWMRETMRRYGWAIQAVAPDGPEEPPFAYTVGLTGFDHPELLVFGLDMQSAMGLLNALGERVRSGAALRDGDIVTVHELPVSLFDVPNPGEILFTANDIYQRHPLESVPALQVVYPDDDGSWPWEPDYQLAQVLQPMPGQFSAM